MRWSSRSARLRSTSRALACSFGDSPVSICPLFRRLVEPAAVPGDVPTVARPVDRLRQQERRLDTGCEIHQPPMEGDVAAQQRPDDGERRGVAVASRRL
jgi:hypothetical protein